MFVVSLTSKRLKKTIIIIAIVTVCLVTGVLCGFLLFGNSSSANDIAVGSVGGSQELLSFISDFGWEVNEEPDEVREIIIPAEFDEVYTNYNAIQLNQGYDLSEYAGERVKRWTYTVKNYPEYIGEDCIKINILVYDGKVIGGDVCSVKLDGFMHGFSK